MLNQFKLTHCYAWKGISFSILEFARTCFEPYIYTVYMRYTFLAIHIYMQFDPSTFLAGPTQTKSMNFQIDCTRRKRNEIGGIQIIKSMSLGFFSWVKLTRSRDLSLAAPAEQEALVAKTWHISIRSPVFGVVLPIKCRPNSIEFSLRDSFTLTLTFSAFFRNKNMSNIECFPI